MHSSSSSSSRDCTACSTFASWHRLLSFCSKQTVAMQTADHSIKHADPNALQEELQRNLELQQLLATLPDRVRHPVMVPVGSVAFFPGNLIHTNECLVDVGQNTPEFACLHALRSTAALSPASRSRLLRCSPLQVEV